MIKTKMCIMCDVVLTDDKLYVNNHYLCSSECTAEYLKIVVFERNQLAFIVALDLLNRYRYQNHNLENLTVLQVNERMDYVET